MKPFRARRGRINYVSELPKNAGEVWGYETFSIMEAPDGMRVAHIHCELDFDGLSVARDIVQSVKRDFDPHDGYVRLTVDGAFRGAASYRFTDKECVCEAFNVRDGAISQRFPLEPRPIRGLGTHALVSDGWSAATLDFARGPYRHDFKRNVVVSTHHLGATGPSIMPTDAGLEFLGEETVRTPAGEFRCRKIAYVGMTTTNHPPYIMWLTMDGDNLYVKGVVEGYLAARFELVELAG
jgi:hypothetical protein